MYSLVSEASPALIPDVFSDKSCPAKLEVNSELNLLRSVNESRLNVASAEVKGTSPLSKFAYTHRFGFLRIG